MDADKVTLCVERIAPGLSFKGRSQWRYFYWSYLHGFSRSNL